MLRIFFLLVLLFLPILPIRECDVALLFLVYHIYPLYSPRRLDREKLASVAVDVGSGSG